MEQPEPPYSRFLRVANEAARRADCEQRRLIRALAAQNLSPEENAEGIEKIMGWLE